MAAVTVQWMARYGLLSLVFWAAPVMAQGQATPAAAASATAANVRTGVDLWRAGDYPGAVAIWQRFANAGDADAMFNIGQAYKLGRALPMDKAIARDWYRKAAAKGHLPAQANLGILLFQAGEKPEAARWLKAAADRGEMRAQYVLGVAHWNGDGVARNMPLAYAYLARASAQGLGEATGALSNLNRTLSPTERANGSAVAASLAAGTGIPADYAGGAVAPVSMAELNRLNADAAQRSASMPAKTGAPPRPVAAALAAPPLPAPLAADAAGRPPPPAVRPVALPASVPASVPAASVPTAASVAAPPDVAPTPVAANPVPANPVAAIPVAAKAADSAKAAGKSKPPAAPAWRVQLGAYGKHAQAEAAWAQVMAKQKAVVGKAKPFYEPGVSIIKLQMGPFKTRDIAKDVCAKIAFGGRSCFVIEA